MALIVEDGTVIASANSYNTIEELRAYATARGVTLAAEDAAGNTAIEVMAIKAMDYLGTLIYIGEEVEPGVQTLAFPRQYIYDRWGVMLPTDEIPAKVKQAQAQLVVEVANGVDLIPTVTRNSAFVKKQKVGPIEREFSEAVYLSGGSTPYMPLVDNLLKEFVASGFTLRAVRV